MSSKDMLDDRLAIDDVNPFVLYPPGAFSEPYPYAVPAPPTDKEETEEPEKSPICSYGVTALSTVTICKPPYDFPPVESCPMSRPLVPMRLTEPGFWQIPAEPAKNPEVVAPPSPSTNPIMLTILAGIVLIALYFYMMR